MFVTVSLYVTTVPGDVTAGVTACVIARSAAVTVIDAVAVFTQIVGVAPVSLIVAVSLMVLPATAVPGFTITTTVRVAVAPPAIVVPAFAVHVIVPVPPAAGFVPHVQFAGGVALENVVLAGVVSVNEAPDIWVVPTFVISCVYVIVPPAATSGLGFAEFVR